MATCCFGLQLLPSPAPFRENPNCTTQCNETAHWQVNRSCPQNPCPAPPLYTCFVLHVLRHGQSKPFCGACGHDRTQLRQPAGQASRGGPICGQRLLLFIFRPADAQAPALEPYEATGIIPRPQPVTIALLTDCGPGLLKDTGLRDSAPERKIPNSKCAQKPPPPILLTKQKAKDSAEALSRECCMEAFDLCLGFRRIAPYGSSTTLKRVQGPKQPSLRGVTW